MIFSKVKAGVGLGRVPALVSLNFTFQAGGWEVTGEGHRLEGMSQARDLTPQSVSLLLFAPAEKSSEEPQDAQALREALHTELDSCKWGQWKKPSAPQALITALFPRVPSSLCLRCPLHLPPLLTSITITSCIL